MMEKRLRQKFVLVAMLSVAAALALILVVINVVNYQSVCRMADDRIEAIIQNGASPASSVRTRLGLTRRRPPMPPW